MDLSNLSEQELKNLRKSISEELDARDSNNFPYLEGDCFFSTNANGIGFSLCRIDKMNRTGIDVTMIFVDSSNNASKHSSGYSYKFFKNDWHELIDSSVFDLFFENQKAIGELKQDFVRKVFSLRKK